MTNIGSLSIYLILGYFPVVSASLLAERAGFGPYKTLQVHPY
jgi:hypothetical protein